MTEEKKKFRTDFTISRTVLLVEIERYCENCRKRCTVGLTESEAAVYDGFECEFCKHQNNDRVSAKDLPAEWTNFTISSE